MKVMLYQGPKQYCKTTNTHSIFIAGLSTTDPAAQSVAVDNAWGSGVVKVV
jgi:hypothetical protein